MALTLVEGGGAQQSPLMTKLLKVLPLKLLPIAALICAYLYASTALHPDSMLLTKLSEHALMPGLAAPAFDRSGLINAIFRDLKNLPKSKSQQEHICDQLKTWQMSCDYQKWKSNVAGVNLSGKNLYTWVRGTRNDGSAAQLVAVELGNKTEAVKVIANVLAFANFAYDQVHLSHDIVFVFVDGREKPEINAMAFDAFLYKYHKLDKLHPNAKHPYTSDPIVGQSGQLLSGIVYRMSNYAKSKKVKIMDVQLNGMNGQQANLDLFNSAAKIANANFQSRMALYGVYSADAEYFQATNPYEIPLKALFTQAFTTAEGMHSLLGKYGVPALTIGLSHEFSDTQSGQFIEQMCRTLNNAGERFHQSYFMYILGDDVHFASIAIYSPIVAILLVPLLAAAYVEYSKLKHISVPPQVVVFHVLGGLLYVSTVWIFEKCGLSYVITTQWPILANSTVAGLTPPISSAMTFLLVSAFPIALILNRKFPIKSIGTLRIICQLEAALAISCLALVNFGLAASAALVAVPLVFMMTAESENKMRSLTRTLVLTILSPLGIIAFFAINAPQYIGYKDWNEGQTEFQIANKIAGKIIRDCVMLGSNNLMYLCLAAIPLWNMLFGCATHYEEIVEQEEQQVIKNKKKKNN